MSIADVNLSDLLNRPKETLSKLQHSPDRALRVHRRAADEEDLLLTTSSRAEQARQASSAAASVLSALLQHSEPARSAIVEAAPRVFPWVRFLPSEDVRVFITELVETLEAADALGNPAPVAQVLAAWRHTAEVHADPELAEILSHDGDDLGAVQEPPAQ